MKTESHFINDVLAKNATFFFIPPFQKFIIKIKLQDISLTPPPTHTYTTTPPTESY